MVAVIFFLGWYLYKDPVQVVAPVQASVTESWREELKGTKLYELAECESGINPLAVNPRDTNGLPSRGLFQYQSETWVAWTTQIDKEKKWNIWSAEDQIIVTKWAMKKGLSTHWPTCSKKVGI